MARMVLRTLVTERVEKEKLARVTLDFDGSVLTHSSAPVSGRRLGSFGSSRNAYCT